MNALTALLAFATWTLVLMLAYVLPRVFATLTLQKKANAWPRDVPGTESPLLQRAHHAHLNCVENLPVLGAIVLTAAAMGKLPVIDMLAPWVFYLRVAQSLVHLSGTGPAQVFVRANFFLLQVALMGWMIWSLAA